MNNKSLLLVDDEISILRSYARDLSVQSYDVTTAMNAEIAIDAIRSTSFNLVVTDLVMPGPSGMKVLLEAKKRDPQICVIVLTGYGDMESAVEALRLGADDYLLKPLDSDFLLLRIEELLTRQKDNQRISLPGNPLTICSYCREIKDDNAAGDNWNWLNWENFLTRKTGIMLSHGCCPNCFGKLKKEWNL
ncbi:MAG: response regulator [Desulfobulbus sp.]|jgi:DNA-binding NtrC family response regulator|nr:response regulator [Desulfobulbus sp.]